MRFVSISLGLLICSIYVAFGQVEFGAGGYGRSILTNNNLSGNILNSPTKDTSSTNKGVSGYFLFDLTTNLRLNKDFSANAIVRVRTPFGSFYGQNVTFLFRQFQMLGRIGNNINYQIGDINIEATPYTVYNSPETYNKYEAETFSTRRNILEYENFIFGTAWRLQGVQGFAKYNFNKGIKQLYINPFGVRTNITNNINTPDRILAGGRVKIDQSDAFQFGGTFVTLRDMVTNITQVDYNNNVLTGDAKFNINNDDIAFQIKGETGFSSYKYSSINTLTTVGYNDYFYDVSASNVFKALKLGVSAGYRNVGPQFSSPSAQTARMNVNTPLGLFSNLNNLAGYQNGSTQRQQTLYDRFTDENVYNRNISPVLYNFLPQYGNVTPYGQATPNRQGVSLGVSTDTTYKVVDAEFGVDVLSEIIGEGTPNLRNYTVLKGGAALNIHKILKWNKRLVVNVGMRNEHTSRAGLSSINFNTLLFDAGLTVEFVKNIDLIGGLKMLNANGNEYASTRNQYNLISSDPTIQSITPFNMNVNQLIYSGGLRIRFTEKSFFIINYNVSNYTDLINSAKSYSINQLFLNYTVKL
jgi:hypothetical protein